MRRRPSRRSPNWGGWWRTRRRRVRRVVSFWNFVKGLCFDAAALRDGAASARFQPWSSADHACRSVVALRKSRRSRGPPTAAPPILGAHQLSLNVSAPCCKKMADKRPPPAAAASRWWVPTPIDETRCGIGARRPSSAATMVRKCTELAVAEKIVEDVTSAHRPAENLRDIRMPRSRSSTESPRDARSRPHRNVAR